MPYSTNPITELQTLTGPRTGFSQFAPELIGDEERLLLGLGPATKSAKKSSLDGTPNGLGKEDFLKLLLAQLSNQDPLRPMEDREFIAQLAQFNTLEQMQQVNRHLVDMVSGQALAQASSLLGHRIVAGPISGEVTGVTMVDGQARLVVDGRQVALSEVTRVNPGWITGDEARE